MPSKSNKIPERDVRVERLAVQLSRVLPGAAALTLAERVGEGVDAATLTRLVEAFEEAGRRLEWTGSSESWPSYKPTTSLRGRTTTVEGETR